MGSNFKLRRPKSPPGRGAELARRGGLDEHLAFSPQLSVKSIKVFGFFGPPSPAIGHTQMATVARLRSNKLTVYFVTLQLCHSVAQKMLMVMNAKNGYV